MQQFHSIAQQPSLIVFPLPAHLGAHTNTPAQRVIVPICRRGVSATHC